MVRALTSQGCGLGSDDTCGLSSLLVLVHAPNGLSLGPLVFLPQQKPTFQILIQPLETVDRKSHLMDCSLLNNNNNNNNNNNINNNNNNNNNNINNNNNNSYYYYFFLKNKTLFIDLKKK